MVFWPIGSLVSYVIALLSVLSLYHANIVPDKHENFSRHSDWDIYIYNQKYLYMSVFFGAVRQSDNSLF